MAKSQFLKTSRLTIKLLIVGLKIFKISACTQYDLTLYLHHFNGNG